jgi:hypothetical protein
VTLEAPLCDAGRCAQLLAGLAEARQRMVTGQGRQLEQAFRTVLDDPGLALTAEQRAAWPLAVARAVEALTGQPAIEGVAA